MGPTPHAQWKLLGGFCLSWLCSRPLGFPIQNKTETRPHPRKQASREVTLKTVPPHPISLEGVRDPKGQASPSKGEFRTESLEFQQAAGQTGTRSSPAPDAQPLSSAGENSQLALSSPIPTPWTTFTILSLSITSGVPLTILCPSSWSWCPADIGHCPPVSPIQSSDLPPQD